MRRRWAPLSLRRRQKPDPQNLIDRLTARGEMEPRLLYESPFTDFDPLGVAGVFTDREAKAVISILEEVRRRAAA